MTDRTRRGRGDGTIHQRAATMDTNNEGEDVTLTEFLLARIAEDEAVALGVRTGKWDALAFHDQADDDIPHIANWSPARVLAECEAKRRIVDEAMEVARHERTVAVMAGVGHTEPTSGETIIRLLALPYADHPDYREEWKP